MDSLPIIRGNDFFRKGDVISFKDTSTVRSGRFYGVVTNDSENGFVRFAWLGSGGIVNMFLNNPELRKEEQVSLYIVYTLLKQLNKNLFRGDEEMQTLADEAADTDYEIAEGIYNSNRNRNPQGG